MKHFLTLALACATIASAAQSEEIPMTAETNAHSFSFKMMDDKELKLSEYKDKVVLVVNTASQCGLTGQYTDLQSLHQNFGDKGLVVLGVPSPDFGGQEFATNEAVCEFTESKYNVTFPLTQINHVKGDAAHPFYKWANKKAGFLGSPKWNFHKYLIAKDGSFVDHFASTTKPASTKVIAAIEKELGK